MKDPNAGLLVGGLVLAFGGGLGLAFAIGSSLVMTLVAAVGAALCLVAQHRMARLPDE